MAKSQLFKNLTKLRQMGSRLKVHIRNRTWWLRCCFFSCCGDPNNFLQSLNISDFRRLFLITVFQNSDGYALFCEMLWFYVEILVNCGTAWSSSVGLNCHQNRILLLSFKTWLFVLFTLQNMIMFLSCWISRTIIRVLKFTDFSCLQ